MTYTCLLIEIGPHTRTCDLVWKEKPNSKSSESMFFMICRQELVADVAELEGNE